MNAIDNLYSKLTAIGGFLSMLIIRLFIAWEFWEAGQQKLGGRNWFDGIVDNFPFPFNVIPTDISWFLATWAEILGAIAIAIGLATRFWALTLIILDVVAWYSVHAGNGYNVCDNGFKLPLIFLLMLLVLLFSGAGKLSVDHIIARMRK